MKSRINKVKRKSTSEIKLKTLYEYYDCRLIPDYKKIQIQEREGEEITWTSNNFILGATTLVLEIIG